MAAPSPQHEPSRPGTIKYYNQLTCEHLPPSSVRSVVIDMVGALLVVLAINQAALWNLDRHPANLGYWLIKHKWELLSDRPGPVKWLLLGDSSGNNAVIPEGLGYTLGGGALNLCTIGNMTVLNDSWMLETYIDRFGPPENVLIIHVYDVWHRDRPETSLLAQIPVPLHYLKRLSPSLEMTIQEQAHLFVTRYLPLYSRNETLKNRLRSPSLFYSQETFDSRMSSGGYMRLIDADREQVKGDASAHIRFVTENEFTMSNINLAALSNIRKLAERYGINIYLINSPLYEGLYKDERFQRYFFRLQSALQDFADQSQHVHLMKTIVTFPASQMTNTDHVVHSAAEIFTERIALGIGKEP